MAHRYDLHLPMEVDPERRLPRVEMEEGTDRKRSLANYVHLSCDQRSLLLPSC